MSGTTYIPPKELMDGSLELRDDYNRFVREKKKNQHAPFDSRIVLSDKYLRGRGIEIGAFHAPVPLPIGCHADYVDKVDIDTLKTWMPETEELYCVYPSVIDDGEKLTKIKNQSYDFLVANHMLEHTENVFRTIDNHIKVVKEGGYIFYALPDKEHTFDKDRELTTYEHLKDEYYNGSEHNKIKHFKEFGKIVSKIEDEALLEDFVNRHVEENRDIHFHVWEHSTFLSQILQWIEETNLNIELVEHAQNGIEFILIFRVLTQLEVAERLIEKGELEEAKEKLSSLASLDKKNLDVQNDLAVVAIMKEEYEEAEKIILLILDVDSSNELALNNYQYLKELPLEKNTRAIK